MNTAALFWMLFIGQIITHAVFLVILVKKNLKKEKTEFLEEFRKEKEPDTTDKTEAERLKKEAAEFKDKLASKEEELTRALSEGLETQKQLKDNLEKMQFLEKENREVSDRLKSLEVTEEAKPESRPEKIRGQKKKKIGEILLEQEFVTREILDKALAYQEKSHCSLTQYLLTNGHINENQLAQCLCTQFGIPYLPLDCYAISDKIIELVPVDLAEKYWFMPVEKLGKLLSVVMVDPLDETALREIEKITGCQVQPFVGILSEIIVALTKYYKITVKEAGGERKLPFFVDTEAYKGPERRNTIRFKAKIDVHFAVDGQYKKSQTKDISQNGLLFESETPLAIGLVLTLQIDIPQEYSSLPIAAIVQVVRVSELENNKFGIGVKIIKISKQELNNILDYASTHEEK